MAPFGQQPTATMAQRSWVSGVYLAVSEQFTHFGSLQLNGHEVANPTNQHEESSITQFVAGYNFTEHLGLQINVPYLYRSFQRPEGFATDRGTEAGLGDISLLGRLVVFRAETGGRRKVVFDDKSPRMVTHEPDFAASVILLAGVKFPTGDSSRLKEEFKEVEIPGAPRSGIHGHDLTLGTGSYDGTFGAQSALRFKRIFFEAEMQFVLRGDGPHQYHFANNITWSAGPGYYFIRQSEVIVGLQGVITGEHKDVDRFQGNKAKDTGITSIFAGPRIVASWRRLSAELAADLPVSIRNTALQVVPDYRLRGGISFSL